MTKRIVDFFDEESTYARIRVDKKYINKITKLLDKYREEDPYYDIEGFLEYLEENGIEFETIPLEYDYGIYF